MKVTHDNTKIILPKSIIDEYNNGISVNEIAKKYNCSWGTVYKNLKEYGVKIQNKNFYSPEQKQWLKDNIKGKSYKEITELFNNIFGTNRTYDQISSTLARLNLKNGIDTAFKKGRIPFNKGLKWDEYVSKEGQENSKKTWFSSEDRSINNSNHNEVPVGSEYVDKNGYIQVKIPTRNGTKARRFWKLKHRLIWEEHYGPIPKGHKVIFADGNNRNFDINNLILVSNSELARMNYEHLYFKGCPDATKSGALIAKMKSKAKELKKKRR